MDKAIYRVSPAFVRKTEILFRSHCVSRQKNQDLIYDGICDQQTGDNSFTQCGEFGGFCVLFVMKHIWVVFSMSV